MAALESPEARSACANCVARNLNRWCSGIMARVFARKTVEGAVEWSSVPVINALGDAFLAPAGTGLTQTFANGFRRVEGAEAGIHRRWQQCRAIVDAGAVRLGMDFALRCPQGYTPDPDIVSQASGEELAAVYQGIDP